MEENGFGLLVNGGAYQDVLLVITDQAGRELASRPEMTSSVTRLVTKFHKQATKSVRLSNSKT